MRLFSVALPLLTFVAGLTSCSTYKQKRIDAYQHLSELKEKGVLLVRLPNFDNKVAYLINEGKEDEAQHTREQEQKLRQKIVEAFREEYDFNPVYFFEADASGDLRRRRWAELALLDTTLNPVPGEILIGKPFLIAEFGRVYSDVLYTENEEGEQVRVGGTSSKEGLVLMDDQFRQLDDPYPYRHFQWSKAKAVRGLNTGLHETLFGLGGRNFVRMAEN